MIALRVFQITMKLSVTLLLCSLLTMVLSLTNITSRKGEKLYQLHKSIEDEQKKNSSLPINQSSPESCTPWSVSSSSKNVCQCPHYSGDILHCEKNASELFVLGCNCATYDAYNHVIEFGKCQYTCVHFHAKRSHNHYVVYHGLPRNLSKWNDYMCGSNVRSGTLCGKCADGYFPPVYSFESNCIKCEANRSEWGKYILAAIVPLIVFYIIILLFEVNIHASWILGFVIFSQQISLPPFLRIVYLYGESSQLLPVWKFLGLFYSIWNLDFFRVYKLNVCLHISPLTAVTLDLGIGVLPLLLMALTYFAIHIYDRKYKIVSAAWTPFRLFFTLFKKNWNVKTSVIDALATFYFLASNKIMLVCFDLLNPVNLYQYHLNSNKTVTSWRLYVDAEVAYFSETHFPHAILAIISITVLVNVPTFIFLLYPFRFFHRSISILPGRLQICLHTFVDTFQGCYEDGTGPRAIDCRWFPGVLFFTRLMVALAFSLCKNSLFLPAAAMTLVLCAILTLIVDPFKEKFSKYGRSLVVFLLFSACVYTTIAGNDVAGLRHFYVKKLLSYLLFITVIPLMIVVLYIAHWLIIIYRNK